MKSAEAARDTAITIVDGLYGYTMEYASSPSEHRQMYVQVEETINDALRAARAEVWEEAAKIAEMHAAIEMPKSVANDKRWRVGHEIAESFRARLSEPPRGPGQGEEKTCGA